jgi:uncharacterized membrane protein YbhN (UPF0104 family)
MHEKHSDEMPVLTVRSFRYQLVRRVLSAVILIGFLTWAGWYVYSNAESFLAIAEVSWIDILILVAAFLVIMVCNGLFIMIVSEAFQVQLLVKEWLSLSFAASFANYFLPFKGGAGMRALYMSRVHRLPLVEFVSTMSIMYLMPLVANGLLAIIGMLLIAAYDGAVNLSLLTFFALLTAAGVLLMVVDLSIDSGSQKFLLRQLVRFLAAWHRVRQNRLLVFKLWALTAVLTLAAVWQSYAAFDAASVSLSWRGAMIYAASKNLATLVSLTPGSLGVVELISIYLGGLLGYGTADALLVQGLIRAVAVGVLLLAGPVALLYLRRRLQNAQTGSAGGRAA